MKIVVVNDIHVGKSLEHQGKVRASSHLVEEMLERFLDEIQRQHSPDLLINLGDLIRSDSQEMDLQAYRRLMGHFQIDSPVIHLLGNHELKKMALHDVETIWQECGFPQKNYGSKDIGDFTLVWLGLELDPQDRKVKSLPLEQLSWLEQVLYRHNRPTLIFTHCAIDDHDLDGNFFYETEDRNSNKGFFLTNQASIREVISRSGCVIAVLQAHLHYFHSKQIEGIPYITCPAMGDNICGPTIGENIPEIYTLLTLKKNQMSVKAFSGKYCFAGFERILGQARDGHIA